MGKKNSRLAGLFLILCFVCSPGFAIAEKVLALGKYDFYHYYDYEELTHYLKDLNKAYPQLTELTSLCKSTMGRDVWMLIINNPKTGKAENKPGFFLNQIHAGEVIASMSCSFTIWQLLGEYGKSEESTRLVDNLVWYIIPRLDVDGAEVALSGKPAGVDPEPVDDDKDGKFDEDPPEDVDGDGFIVQMRQKDAHGEWKASPEDPRMMVRRAADETAGTYYQLYGEGIDNDGDEKINEDSFRSRFLSNRNYPANWRPQGIQGGGGAYPMEERTTRAEVDFVAMHPNIAIYVQHHCCGRVILRAPTTGPDKDFKFQKDLELYRVITTRGLEHTGWNLATSVFDWNFPPDTGNKKSTQVYRDKDGAIKNAPKSMYPEDNAGDGNYGCDSCGFQDDKQFDRGYFAWGSSLETMYEIFGIFSLADEHWDSPDYDKDGEVTEKEKLKWNDEDMGGKSFIGWHASKHPTLGEVEIGGWKRTKSSPPEGDLIQKECEMGNRYVLYLASLAPKIRVSEAKVVDKKAGIYEVTMAVENIGALPTATEQGESLGLISPVQLEVEPDGNTEILFGQKQEKLGNLQGNSESRKMTYILRVRDTSKKAVLKAIATSPKAGRDIKEIAIK